MGMWWGGNGWECICCVVMWTCGTPIADCEEIFDFDCLVGVVEEERMWATGARTC